MKLTVLEDNYTFTDKYCYAEPGLSYYIEDEDDKILFDCGYSGMFADNAEKMGLDLSKLTKVVFSHGHDDHTGGLLKLTEIIKDKTKITAHPDTFLEKTNDDGSNAGSPLSGDELSKRFRVSLSKEPQKVSANITFLGEIPQINDFEKRKQFGYVKHGKELVPDFVPEDSALVYEKSDCIYIITGCSHAGVCNIAEYAKNLFEKPVAGIIGGFHLKTVDERVRKTIEYFKNNNIKTIYPAHCTSFEVKSAINYEIPVGVVGVGLNIEW